MILHDLSSWIAPFPVREVLNILLTVSNGKSRWALKHRCHMSGEIFGSWKASVVCCIYHKLFALCSWITW